MKNKTKPHPKQIILDSINKIYLLTQETPYEAYIKKELKLIKNMVMDKN